MNIFKTAESAPVPKSVRQLNMIFSEESLNNRKLQIRGFMTLNQVERLYLVTSPTSHTNKLPKKDNKIFAGTTSGDTFYPVECPDVEKQWKTTLQIKKLMYGATNRILATGYDQDHKFLKDVVEDETCKSKVKRNDSTVEPVTFYGVSEDVYEEVVYRTNASAIIHLTPTDHTFAGVALKLRKPYLAVTMTEDHSRILSHRIKQHVFETMSQEGTQWYNAELAKVLQPPTDQPQPKPKAKTKGKPEGKPEAKPPKAEAEAEGKPDEGEPPTKKPRKGSALAAIQAALDAGTQEETEE